MKQATLQLKTKIQNVNITNNNIEIERMFLNGMLIIIAGLSLMYIFILGNMVFNIVQRKALEKESLTLSNEVGNLELSYLSIFNHVDLALSSSMGFKEAHASFAVRKTLGFSTGTDTNSLKINKNEI